MDWVWDEGDTNEYLIWLLSLSLIPHFPVCIECLVHDFVCDIKIISNCLDEDGLSKYTYHSSVRRLYRNINNTVCMWLSLF